MTSVALDFDAARELFKKARDPKSGKPLQHATRLFTRNDGDMVICHHWTDIVTIHADGTFTLANGGYRSITTLQRLRSYAPINGTLFSEHSQWYVRTCPNSKDPRPDRVRRSIRKPYVAFDPGPEPVKNPQGCIAGTSETYEYQADEYIWDWRERTEAQPWHFKFTRGKQRMYRRAGVDTIHYTEDGSYRTGTKQCPHCKAFDVIHSAWKEAMYYGNYWHHRFDSPHGYATYLEMMDRFGGQEAWHEAYLEDLRARRAYIKAEREWDERNRIVFYDGIRVSSDGYPVAFQE